MEQLDTGLPDEIRAAFKELRKFERSLRGFGLKLDQLTPLLEVQQLLSNAASRADSVAGDLAAYKDLARTAALVNSSLELDRVLNETMDTMIALTGAERGYLVLVDDETGKQAVPVARNLDRETLNAEDFAFSRNIVRQVAEDGEPVLTTDATADPRFSGYESVMTRSLRSILCVPLKLRGKVIGVIYTDNRGVTGRFGVRHLELLTAFANQAAIAIANARQFGRVKDDLAKAQREVETLRIQIDEAQRREQVAAITESEFFQHLRERVKELRARREEAEG
ncbi:MAG: hypothetical protein Kow00120_03270 [Anaerolineae bacterium]